jgi:hypothetical protein
MRKLSKWLASAGFGYRLRTLTLAYIAIATLGLASSATPVQAQTPRHCVKNLAEPDAPAVCHNNFTAAIAAATLGQIKDAPADVRDAMSDEGLQARLNHTGEKRSTTAIQPRAGLVIAIVYDDRHYRGDSRIYTGNRPCTDTTNDIDFHVRHVGHDWNDEIGSIRLYNNCYARLWEHADFHGAMLDFAGDRPYLGILDEEVSSIQFS